MANNLNLRSRSFWQSVLWGLLTGLISAVGAFILLGLMNF
jgi:hypothetical protein